MIILIIFINFYIYFEKMGLKEKVIVAAGLIGGLTLMYYIYKNEGEELTTNRGSDLDNKLLNELENLNLAAPIENISF